MLERLKHTIEPLLDAVPSLEADALSSSAVSAIVDRKHFRPEENEAIAHWFARFLTQRDVLWTVINEVDAQLDVPLRCIESTSQWQHFVLGLSLIHI